MTALEVARNYFAAWERHDPDAIVATFADGGTYSDPAAGTLSGPAIGAYAGGLFAAFPDLTFEVVDVATTDAGTVVAQWVMRGTNRGPFRGAPPTGRTIALPGADFITVDGDRVRAVQGYFDQRAFVEQLGLQVIVQPYTAGPFAFGSAILVHKERPRRPGAVGLTKLLVRSPEERQRVIEFSRQIAIEMLEMPGFLGWVGVTIGQEMYTITAWEDAEAPRQLLKGGTHLDAVRHIYRTDFASGGMLSVWAPVRIKVERRCEACGRLVIFGEDEETATCECGASIPLPNCW